MPTPESEHQAYRTQQIAQLPARSGVYALCDLDEVPIYVGKSLRAKAEGIRPRVRRHLTSARSDVVANRQLDVWEVAFVWGWAVEDDADVASLESHLFHLFDEDSPLVNGTVPTSIVLPDDRVPTKVRVQIMTDDEINTRRQPRYRFPRQVQQFNQLLDYILITKDEPHLRRALDVHFRRVHRFYEAFRNA